MTRDFAKKARQPDPKKRSQGKSGRPQVNNRGSVSKHNDSNNSSRIPGWVWLFTGAILGAFIMFLAYLSGITEQSTEALSTPDSGNQQSSKTDIPKPRFDFYKLLKENEVVVKTTPSTARPADQDEPKEEFILQVGSFKKIEDADRLRAELILMNLNAQVETVTVRNGQTWHRVLVGPYYSSSTVSKARSILVSKDINPLLLKRKRS